MKRLLVKLKPNVPQDVRHVLPLATTIRRLSNGVLVAEVPGNVDCKDCCRWMNLHPDVEYAEEDQEVYLGVLPNDPYFEDGSAWHLFNYGQDGGTPGADIGAVSAWNKRTYAGTVVVAVVDSGADINHPDLARNIWNNPEPDTSLNDLHGWNARNETSDVSDLDGHGTAVAGIIGAIGNNSIGVCGVVWSVQLMILKFTEGTSGLLSDAVQCIDYALSHGAHVINCSWGTTNWSQALYDIIDRCRRNNILVVCSAGNGGVNTDFNPHYPASFDLPNIISVAATDRNDQLMQQSNYGVESVDLAAPGVDIPTTSPFTTEYVTFSGTSAAAPVVTGAVAMLLAEFSGADYKQIKSRILSSVRQLSSLSGMVLSGGRLDLAMAVLGEPFPPRVRLSAQWPQHLPLPRIEYTGSVRTSTLVSSSQFGLTHRRSRTAPIYTQLSVEWVFNREEYVDFKTFFIEEIGCGTALFELSLRHPKDSELADWAVRFVAGYKVQSGDGIWRVSAELDLVHPVVLSPLALRKGYGFFFAAPDSSNTEPPQFMTSESNEFAVLTT